MPGAMVKSPRFNKTMWTSVYIFTFALPTLQHDQEWWGHVNPFQKQVNAPCFSVGSFNFRAGLHKCFSSPPGSSINPGILEQDYLFSILYSIQLNKNKNYGFTQSSPPKGTSRYLTQLLLIVQKSYILHFADCE